MKQKLNRLIAASMTVALVLQGAPALATNTSTNISTFSTVGQPISDYFSDSILAQKIAWQLNKNVTDSITGTELQTITSLYLSGGSLTNLSGIEYLTGLKTLYISNTSVQQLPESISNLSKLDTLYLYNNRISELPTSFGSLRTLRDISIYEPNLYKVPTSIGDLNNLQVLRIQSNILTSLPTTIGQLYNLKTLSVYSPKFNLLPDTIGQLPKLETLYLGSTIPEIAVDDASGTIYHSYNSLYQDGVSPAPSPIKELPNSLGNLTKLKQLSISFTSLTSIPSWVDGMYQLEELFIEGNPYISTIPADIGNLYKLRRLSLAGNNLSTLPNNWAQLKQLQYLDISKNHLYELPSEMIDLTVAGSQLDTISNFSPIISGVGTNEYWYYEHYGLFAQTQKSSIPQRIYPQSSSLTWSDILPPLIVQSQKVYNGRLATLSDDINITNGTLWVKHSTDTSDTRSYSLQQLLSTASGLQPSDLFKQAGTYQLTFKTEDDPSKLIAGYFVTPWWNQYTEWYRANNLSGHNYTYTIEIQSGIPTITVPTYNINTVATTDDGQYKITIKGDIEEQLNNGFNQLTPAQIDNQMLSIKIQNLNTNENKNATVSTINTIFAYVKNGKITGIIIYGNAKTANGTKQTYSVLLGTMGE